MTKRENTSQRADTSAFIVPCVCVHEAGVASSSFAPATLRSIVWSGLRVGSYPSLDPLCTSLRSESPFGRRVPLCGNEISPLNLLPRHAQPLRRRRRLASQPASRLS